MPGRILEGTITQPSKKFVGRHEVLWAPPDGSTSHLLIYPGATTEPNGRISISENLLRTGQHPGTLYEYAPDAQLTTPSGLRLKEYQRRAVTFLRQLKKEDRGAILGADAGTGKTAIVLQYLWLEGYLHRKGIIVGPLGAKDTWCSEGGDPFKHFQLKVVPLEGTTPDEAIFQTATWFFVHYDILPAWRSWLYNLYKPNSLVIDESHSCMNADAQRTKETYNLSLCSLIERRIALTGTPIPKTRMDLHGQLSIVQPTHWGSRHEFGIRYADGKYVVTEGKEEGQGWWTYEGQTNTEELRARLAGVYLRFTKADIPGELPKLQRHVIDIELSTPILTEYKQAQNDLLGYMKKQGKLDGQTITIAGQSFEVAANKPEATQLISISVLKSILARGKMEHVINILVDICDKHNRIVVFTWKRDEAANIVEQLKLLYEKDQSLGLSKYKVFGPIDGADPWDKRVKEAHKFTACDKAIFVATRGSVGISINALAAADACIQTMPDWNPDGNLQAESRLHREGNPHPEVHSYYLIARHTIDDRVIELLRKKAEEAKTLASVDESGCHLAADLDPTMGDDQWSLEEICQMFKEIEED